jgi:hypothetical protein
MGTSVPSQYQNNIFCDSYYLLILAALNTQKILNMNKDKVTAILRISMSSNMCIIKMGSFVSSAEEWGE